MSLVTHLERAGNASLTYFKGLMHAGDARLCVENENWVPAAVSLYYAVFDLAIAAILCTDGDPGADYVVQHYGQPVQLGERIMQGEDPYRLITHNEAVRFAQRKMDQRFADALVTLRELREFASYKPRRNIRQDGTRWVDVCEIDAPTFVARVQQESRRLEIYFRLFRDYLQERRRSSQDHEAYWLADADIRQHAREPIEELGRYRSRRATGLAEEIHAEIYQEQAEAERDDDDGSDWDGEAND